MIRDKNVDQTAGENDFACMALNFPLSLGAGVAGVVQGGWRAHYAGKIVAASVYAVSLTDADDSVRIDVKKNGSSVLSATTDPGSADVGTAMALSTTTATISFAVGDLITIVATTGAGDAMVGTATVIVRPRVGRELMPGFTTT